MNDKQTKLKLLKSFYSLNVNKEMLYRICFIKDDKEIISWLTPRQQVIYAYKCASSVTKYISQDRTECLAFKCLNLVKQWLDNFNSVTEKELEKTALDTWVSIADNNERNWAVFYAASYVAYAARDTYDSINSSGTIDAAFVTSEVTIEARAPEYRQKQQQINLNFLIETVFENE